MTARSYSVAKVLTADHVDNNYAVLYTGTGTEYITNWYVRAEIKNPEVPYFSPPPPDGLQDEADRQTQLRSYAESLKQYKLGLFTRKNGTLYKRKTIPIFKYYPDHQIDLFPLLFGTSVGTLSEGEEVLFRFEGSDLPAADDSITVFLYYQHNDDAPLSEAWWTINVSGNQESSIQLPDNVASFSFKQRDGIESLKWSYSSGVVSATEGYDLLGPNFEERNDNPSNKFIYFTNTVNCTVLVKARSDL